MKYYKEISVFGNEIEKMEIFTKRGKDIKKQLFFLQKNEAVSAKVVLRIGIAHAVKSSIRTLILILTERTERTEQTS